MYLHKFKTLKSFQGNGRAKCWKSAFICSVVNWFPLLKVFSTYKRVLDSYVLLYSRVRDEFNHFNHDKFFVYH